MPSCLPLSVGAQRHVYSAMATVGSGVACTTCHAPTAEKKIGPGWKGLFGSTVEMTDGSKVLADENYIRESIENPNAKVVKGFPASMNSYKGQINETDMGAIIAYIKSLK